MGLIEMFQRIVRHHSFVAVRRDCRRAAGRAAATVALLCLLLAMGGCGTKQKVAIPHPEPVDAPLPAPVDPMADAAGRIRVWHTLMQEKLAASPFEKLESVNRFFNQLQFLDDLSLWGKEDYWATPTEMLVSNGGDCEDFATAKYFTLRRLDIPDEQLRLTYVKSLKLNKPHMVLSYYAKPDSDPLVLDSDKNYIQAATERRDLLPVYSFNAQGLWLNKQRQEVRIGGSEQLSLWQDLQQRWLREAVAGSRPTQ
ncbi:MAG: hypothetical protein A2521_04130 [Deltaproteobacteria bacterium RIFOXYD12_FULL_57_12]|nr:MAG: hypothetical protein A2521_04130 [Deltaproteobacteria bacterium RIFOXYD12_FULL_57_12]